MSKVKLTSHVYDNLPQNIRIYRALRGLRSDAELADRIGITHGALSYRLCHPKCITAEMIDQLCRILHLRPAQLWEPIEINENCKPLEVLSQ